ncbi:hypothetical protein ACIQNU_43195 [Streptomyces sp. NPDC091292]|uniref:hypothetical protein n=1 Tax=Streptomyces sp. NPDC091292 TaxID=3365991 RepID=UPI0038100AC0
MAVASVAALVLVLLGAPTATAGGPTSVLVVSPESAQARAFYYSDREYDELMRLLGQAERDGEKPPEDLKLGNAGRQINVTWMAHDISPWRLDRVFPDQRGTDAVWIHTTQTMSDIGEGTWHRAKEPKELRTLVKKLGLMGKASPQGAGGIFPEPATAPEETAAPETEVSETAAPAPHASAAKASTGPSENWWWSVPGLAAGALLALFLRPIALRAATTGPVASWRRRGKDRDGDRDRDPGLRQELRDL